MDTRPGDRGRGGSGDGDAEADAEADAEEADAIVRRPSPLPRSYSCALCPGVQHAECASPVPPFCRPPSTCGGDPPATISDSEDFVCGDCSRELDMSRTDHRSRWNDVQDEIRLHICVTRLSSRWRKRAERRRAEKVSCAVLFLQSVVRAYRLRQEYKRRRRAVPRPFRVDVVSGYDLAAADWTGERTADPYVVLTVLDEHGNQIWRYDGEPVYDTVDPRFNQTYLIPGCAGTAMLAVTVLDRDDMRDQFLGQCLLPLSMDCRGADGGGAGVGIPRHPRDRVEVWEKGGKFRLALDALRHMPKTTCSSDVALDAGAVDLTSVQPVGQIVIRVRPMERSKSACGYLKSYPVASTVSLGREGAKAVFSAAARRRRYWCVTAEHTLYFFKTFGRVWTC